jgi:aspartyl-tRNA synthetase
MHRTHHCGELRLQHVGQEVILSGWVQRKRDKGGMIWIDLRDRYGITQLAFDESKTQQNVLEMLHSIGREYVIKCVGKVVERYSKNDKIPTGEIEVFPESLEILSISDVPPFTIEDVSDGSDEHRMKYRYLDIRRNPVKEALILRHKIAQETRKFLDNSEFLEIETPNLIKSTPEGARDFVVPSRMHPGTFYALPQSPQTFKQLLMLGGMDKYFQIVKCYRDEDLRADRQPEFTQIDCEMAFVEQEDVMNQFEALMIHLFKTVKNHQLVTPFPRMSWHEAMDKFGSDKPDIRFGMEIHELTNIVQNQGFKVFDMVEYVGGICAENCAGYSRKELDELTKFVQKPQIGAKGLVYVKWNEDGSFKSSVDKFFDESDLKNWAEQFNAKPGDLLLILAGDKRKTQEQLCELRLEMGSQLGLRDVNQFAPLWVVDFPLLEWDEESQRFYAMHHPFTSAKPEDVKFFDTNPGKIRANAYDMVINGVELGGGSIRIHDKDQQARMFKLLGFSDEEANAQFGFLLNAFRYGVPPHGGIAFGFDRICALFGGSDSIRDYIAFPKNNAGRDIMIDAPSPISNEQLDELELKIDLKTK